MTTEKGAAPKRLRILCLHGYHGSADALVGQMAPLVAGLGDLVELVPIDAPSRAAGDFGWWHAVDDERDPPSDDPGVDGRHRHYKGWERTRAAIVLAFARLGPFDGVFGFSQGAALTGLLVGLRTASGEPTADRPLRFRFAIMVGGFSARDPELLRLYANEDGYALPSLHLMGRSDGIVPIADSRALAARFASPTIVEHEGGHVIASEARDRVAAFLRDQLAKPSKSLAATLQVAVDVALWGPGSAKMHVVGPRGRAGALTPALVIFRGGGYATSAGSGAGSAEWAAEHGMLGVEVPYRTQASGDAFPKNFADAARAVRLVRKNAATWGVDPAKVGVLGFSAGGHLAGLLGTQPNVHVEPGDDLAPTISPRPDFLVLGYPVVSFVDGWTPRSLASSAENFFGSSTLDEATRRRFSNELHVAAGSPPAFLWTTEDDGLVPADHAKRLASACERAGVPVHLELFAHGPHGMGLALDAPTDVATWTTRLLTWLAERGVLPKPG